MMEQFGKILMWFSESYSPICHTSTSKYSNLVTLTCSIDLPMCKKKKKKCKSWHVGKTF